MLIKGKEQTLDKIVFVVSRLPPELRNNRIKEILQTMKQLLRSGLDDQLRERSKIFKFHSDLDTHLDPQLQTLDNRFIKKGNQDMVQIHEDTLMILAELCPELCPESVVGGALKDQAYALWYEIFGYDFEISYKYRLFGFVDSLGEIKNPDDKKRNVAFKVDTFLNFLNNFYKTLKDKFGDTEECEKMMYKALINAGVPCGEAFGISLVELWGFTKEEKEEEEDGKI